MAYVYKETPVDIGNFMRVKKLISDNELSVEEGALALKLSLEQMKQCMEAFKDVQYEVGFQDARPLCREERIKLVTEYRNQGYSVKKIAQKTCLDRKVVYNYLKVIQKREAEQVN